MSIIKVSDLTFCYEGSYDNIFENVSFQLDTDWRLGLTGRNGRGKTTLLRLLEGRYPYQGTIHASVGFDYFPYAVEEPSLCPMELLERVCPDVAPWRFLRELAPLEVSEDTLYRPFSTLSGGEQSKLLLAMLFSRENRFLLIDEPTNHLDQVGRALVSRYLRGKKGFLLVSHDRAFLDGCVDHILSINRSSIEVQKGNFSSWYENKRRQDAFELSQNERLKKEIGRLKEAARQSSDWADRVEGTKIGKNSAKVKGLADAMGGRDFVAEQSRRMQQRRKNLERRQQNAIEEKSALLKDIERCFEAASADPPRPAAGSAAGGVHRLRRRGRVQRRILHRDAGRPRGAVRGKRLRQVQCSQAAVRAGYPLFRHFGDSQPAGHLLRAAGRLRSAGRAAGLRRRVRSR